MNIVVADDQSLIRELVGASLSHMFPYLNVYQASDAADAIQKAKVHRPELILIDLHMPGLCSFEASRQIRTFLPETKIAIFTGTAEAKLAIRSRDQKLNGYILKAEPGTEFKRAIDTIMSGGYYSPPSLKTVLSDTELSNLSRYNLLTYRELEVLTLMFGQSLTGKEVAHALGISYKTVETHCSALRKKLCNPTRSQLVHFCLEMNLVSKDQLRMPEPAHGFDAARVFDPLEDLDVTINLGPMVYAAEPELALA